MDQEEKKRLRELRELEEKYGDWSEELVEEDEEKRSMPVEGASLRDIGRIKEKRRRK